MLEPYGQVIGMLIILTGEGTPTWIEDLWLQLGLPIQRRFDVKKFACKNRLVENKNVHLLFKLTLLQLLLMHIF